MCSRGNIVGSNAIKAHFFNETVSTTMKTKITSQKLMIQTAGRHNKCKGPMPRAKNKTLILYADKLYNPYHQVKDLSEKEAILKTQKILLKKNKEQVVRMISKGKQAIITGKDVIIVCKYGKHRSKAIAHLLGNFLPNRTFLDHRN